MSKKMELAYKALRIEDAAEAVICRAITAIAYFVIAAIVTSVIGCRELTIVWFVGILVTASVTLVSYVAKALAARARSRTGFSEVELERLALA